MRITVERPKEEEIHHLFGKYGEPVVRELSFDLRERDEKEDYPKCIGGCTIIARAEKGIVLVRHRGSPIFHLPGGRILEGETIEEGALREAWEETGLTVELTDMPELHKCQYLFKNWNLERWVFVFVADVVSGDPNPRDREEISEVAVFKRLPPHFSDAEWLQRIWKNLLGP